MGLNLFEKNVRKMTAPGRYGGVYGAAGDNTKDILASYNDRVGKQKLARENIRLRDQSLDDQRDQNMWGRGFSEDELAWKKTLKNREADQWTQNFDWEKDSDTWNQGFQEKNSKQSQLMLLIDLMNSMGKMDETDDALGNLREGLGVGGSGMKPDRKYEFKGGTNTRRGSYEL